MPRCFTPHPSLLPPPRTVMNRYPLWINLLIGFTLLIGVVYTLPNFFGEVPAIQVSAAKSTQKVDADLQKRVEASLNTASISNDPGTLLNKS